MAHSHYVVDLFYPGETSRPEDLRRDVMRIEADSDEAAIEEAVRISSWREPVRYEVRAIVKGARTGHRLVHASASRAEPAAAADVATDGQA